MNGRTELTDPRVGLDWILAIAGVGLTGLGRGGQQITKCRETFAMAVQRLVELASLQVRPPSLPPDDEIQRARS